MSNLVGRRMPDKRIGGPPPADRLPGDYWRVLTYEGDRPLDVLNHHEDRTFWVNDSDTTTIFDSNLTGSVWEVVDPLGHHGMLSVHTVREHEDGTISVQPGDGSSNSILIKHGENGPSTWHGYIDHGVWQAC